MQVLVKPFIWIMEVCYSICKNYGLAIILFTLLSKIILLPLSVWVQKNSIKMVQMQPDLNFAKAKYFGDKEQIAEEHSRIYKKYKYSPFITIIPTIIQLILLMAVIEVIKYGINCGNFDMNFLGFSLAVIPTKVWGLYILSPVLAALSALLMCICQNKSNVIQAEQAFWSQAITLTISVGLSLYLGFFVSVGVVIYWIFSNLFSIAQLYILNFFINPKKYVDYERLEESKNALKELESLGGEKNKNNPKAKANAKREKQDYKRFFSVVNKHLVFYSESNGFYKYFSGMIDYLLEKTNITIHYITSDPEDCIFQKAEENKQIRAYYIGEKKLITLMMKMDADLVVMTVPDLENYHIKRSYVRKDIEYIFVQHGMGSVNMTYRKGALDHFDTVFCAIKSQKEEILAQEKAFNLPAKKLVETGFFVLDEMMEAYEKMDKAPLYGGKPCVLIAPSWQEGNIVESCLEKLLESLGDTDYHIIVRPHPQHVRHKREKLEKLKEQFSGKENIEVQLDFSATDTVWKSDLLITDWSDIAAEFAFCTHRPVLYINTPMKVTNPDWQKIDVVPINIALRNKIGTNVDPEEIEKVPEIIRNLLNRSDEYERIIEEYTKNQVYNVGHSAEVGGKYIVERLMEIKKNKSLNN